MIDLALLRRRVVVSLAVGCATVAAAAVAQAAEPLEFNRDIRPILSDKCFACHGLDAKHREGDLRLDTAEGAYADHNGTRAITPRELANSELWKRINSTDADEVMPPPKSQKKITEQEKQILKRWIEEGATYQKHWAFERPIAQKPPRVAGFDNKTTNQIDAFIADRLRREGLKMAPEADRATLIRRVSFALTGLPPKSADVTAFVADQKPQAYERMVNRYLASESYGEEMGRHWLDVARYADTHGLHLDNERQMWAYRDWVVNAFNRNLPFDQFTIDQLAGDLVPNGTPDQVVATGFNRCNITTGEGGSIAAEWVYRYAVDRTSTMMQAWMGLTGGCAQCHDHKFDPISQKEFYSFYAFFNSAADPAMDGNALLTQPVMKIEASAMKSKFAEIDDQIAMKQRQIDEQAATVEYTDPGSLSPPPAATEVETVWFDDQFPSGAQLKNGPGVATTYADASKGEPVLSGKRALKRKADGLAQDYYEGGAAPLEVPEHATIFANVYLDAKSPPKTIMLQFHKGGWKHRAVWGDYDAIAWGKKGTAERVHFGDLPKVGGWVRLEIPVEKLGLAAGDRITGIACTQFGGTVYWDKIGISGKSDPARDPLYSFVAWWKAVTGKDTPGISPDLNEIAKAGPEKDPTDEDEKRLLAFYLQNVCVTTKPQFTATRDEIAKLRTDREQLEKKAPSTFVYKDLPKPRQSFVMLRGAYDKPGEMVMPDVLAVLPPLPKKSEPGDYANRLDLAKWLVSPEHPLTSRVAVNRFWQQFFGTGLVKSSSDFGSQGDVPSHPELLDFLSVNFQENGWNVQELVRLMLNSATFRQETRVTRELYTRDPENRLYARGPRFRLDAEQIRDNVLFVSGLLSSEIGGKGVKPYQPGNIWEPLAYTGSNTRFYKRDDGQSLYRRSIYTFLKRTAPPPFMSNFDAPNRESICTKRERSNTPLQALQLMNDEQHIEAARAFAERILTDGGKTPAEQIAFAYRTVLARDPDAVELSLVQEELAKHLARYKADEDAAKKLITHGESKPNAKLPPADLAAFTLVANMILNLDETLTRN